MTDDDGLLDLQPVHKVEYVAGEDLLVGCIHRVTTRNVGVTKAEEVGCDDSDLWADERDDAAVVEPIPGPAMQQYHRMSGTRAAGD